ncbi:protein of unknown function [Ralstonia solanacearum CFBP2957]|nr:protein of unknown function [Ralstonia solanacearum CFBP2957]
MGRMRGERCSWGELNMFPKLRENVWHIDPERETSVLVTSRATYNVPTQAALHFLKMRSYCTGLNSIDSIAEKSGLSPADVTAILNSLEPAGILYAPSGAQGPLEPAHVHDALLRACRIWSTELRMSYIGNEFASGELPKSVLLGWLIEMYHYIKDFPHAIEHAARFATGRLKTVIEEYAAQEKGHEWYVLQTLVNLGLSEAEVRTSIPLPSTRLIGFLMRELYELEPASVLMVASVVEAQEFVEDHIEAFKMQLHRCYQVEPAAFDPYFRHQQIDAGLGHASLLSTHLDLVNVDDRQTLDRLINQIHDLKHAFDLQSTEIKSYYTTLQGRYFPRQALEFSSI